MKNLNFRTLRANEIDCRISTVTENGISLLLYKDARVDQNILDETVGPMDWQRRHVRDNANCIVSIWDSDKEQWIEKEDTGTESNAEKEKGLASDSFKRACFNWGIGRELYTAPFIWISSEQCKVVNTGKKSGNKEIFTCYDKFYVSEIGYDKNRNINQLSIKNKKGKIVFQSGFGQESTVGNEEETQEQSFLEEQYVNAIFLELKRTGVGLKPLLKNYKVGDIHELTFEQFKNAMDSLKNKPDLAAATAPPDDMDTSGLPWNTPGK